MNIATKKALATIASGNSYTVITREIWKNGQETRESHRYTANEMAECYAAEEIEALAAGKVIERKSDIATIQYVSAEALARAAFAKKAVR